MELADKAALLGGFRESRDPPTANRSSETLPLRVSPGCMGPAAPRGRASASLSPGRRRAERVGLRGLDP